MVANIPLVIADIFEKHPYYDIAQDLTAVQDILVWDNLTSIDRLNYQSIASRINLQWESWRIPSTENYADELNATNLRGYLRDEVYAFEISFLLKNGKQTDGFHIPGRTKGPNENTKPDVPDTNPDFVGSPTYISGGVGYSPYWKIYNTASVTGTSPGFLPDSAYKGPYQYGEFAYWESTEKYPCNVDVWGDLADQPIRHHKFPDVLVSSIYESKIFSSPSAMVMGNDAVFPIGVNIDIQQVSMLIDSSGLTAEQKDDVIGFKIVRGDRGTNKSIIAKGILRNVGKYTREEQDFYFPNYPYNDLHADPFLTKTNNAYEQICETYTIDLNVLQPDASGGADYADVQYTDCNTNKRTTKRFYTIEEFEWCSTEVPTIIGPAQGTVGVATYEEWVIWNTNVISSVTAGYYDPVVGYTTAFLCPSLDPFCTASAVINIVVGTTIQQAAGAGTLHASYRSTHTPTLSCKFPNPLPPIEDDLSLAYRQIFNSPETSFGQPFLGDILKLESVMFGAGSAHFVEVRNNATYKLLSEAAQRKALDSSNHLGALTSPFNASAMFAAYQSYLTIYITGITRKNFAYSFNSIADYNYGAAVPNDLGIKQRDLDINRYLIPGVESVGDDLIVNNYQRESSVYLKTKEKREDLTVIPALPFPNNTPSLNPSGVAPIVSDNSRFTISEAGLCNAPAKETPINVVAYYASLKNQVVNQWGQIYSYETIDTGFQKLVDSATTQSDTIFGGDTFISRFAFKTKLPFFIDNRVDAPDDSDIFYDEIGNVAYPKYWHSARSILKNYSLMVDFYQILFHTRHITLIVLMMG